MLKRIKIENLRGIREGEIDGLTRLVVLVGPNGSGKSTVLEGALVAGARYPADAIGIVARRRVHTWNGAAWLIRGADEKTFATTEVEWSDGTRITRRVRWDPRLLVREAIEKFSELKAPIPWSALRIFRDHPAIPGTKDGVEVFSVTAVAGNNEYLPYDVETDLQPPPLRLVDLIGGQPLHDLFTQAVKAGRRDDILASARMVLPDLDGIEILTENSEPRLCFTFRAGSVFVVPVSLAGDGIHALLRTAYELASPIGGTVLLEEPELHMHPRAMFACSKAIVAAARRDVQVIMTTHSKELIDVLLNELTAEEVADSTMMTVLKIRLRDSLLVTRIPASDARQVRLGLDEDLR